MTQKNKLRPIIAVLLSLCIISCGKASSESIDTHNNIVTTSKNYESTEALIKEIDKEVQTVIENVEKSYEKVVNEIGSSYDDYAKKPEVLTDWYASVATATSDLCERLDPLYEQYVRLAFDLYAEDEKGFSKAIDDFYDDVYSGALEDVYDDIYSGVLEDAYDDFYSGVVEDAYDSMDFSEWSKIREVYRRSLWKLRLRPEVS